MMRAMSMTGVRNREFVRFASESLNQREEERCGMKKKPAEREGSGGGWKMGNLLVALLGSSKPATAISL